MPLAFDTWEELETIERVGGKFVSLNSLLQIAHSRGNLIARGGMQHKLDSSETELLRGRYAELESLINALEKKDAILPVFVDG